MTSRTGTCRETDAQLVARTRDGDISAFETIVERYRAVMIARAYARLGSFADAEDVAQEAFVQAFFHLHDLRDPRALLPWLRRVTDRHALMHLRRRREEPVAPSDLEHLAPSQPDTRRPTDTADVGCLLARLPEAMREAVSLTFLAGYTCAEAARIAGVKEGTIKSRLNRAQAKLREVLGVTERDMGDGQPTREFTRRTIERLKREARRLIAEGDVEQASRVAWDVLREQVKPLFGDPERLGIAKTFLAGFDSAAFKPDEEAVAMLGLSRREQRRRECEANAAQYGFALEDLDWEVLDVDQMSRTLARPTGRGKDVWGVPVSRMQLDIIDARGLCQRLRVSPLALHEWVNRGCPILRCWPFARFDAERVEKWLAENGIRDWPTEDEYSLERPIRAVFRAVYEGQISAEQAEEVMESLGYGAWEAPAPGGEGGWSRGRT